MDKDTWRQYPSDDRTQPWFGVEDDCEKTGRVEQIGGIEATERLLKHCLFAPVRSSSISAAARTIPPHGSPSNTGCR